MVHLKRSAQDVATISVQQFTLSHAVPAQPLGSLSAWCSGDCRDAGLGHMLPKIHHSLP
jgi:hypothetical protein